MIQISLPSAIRARRTFLLYALIGVSGVIADLAVFFILYNVVGIEKNIASFISISLAITNNFLWNTFVNFKVKDQLLRRYLRFYAVGLTGIALTSLIFLIFVDAYKINTNVVKLGSLFPVLLLQYSLNKRWAFKEQTNEQNV